VREGMGELIDAAEPEALTHALERAWVTPYDRVRMRVWAETFGPERFARELRAWVDKSLTGGPARGPRARDAAWGAAKRAGLARYA
jgi:hypothetical protein